MLKFVVQSDGSPLEFTPRIVALASYTGRDRAAVQHHLDELAKIGVAPPKAWPVVYPVTTDRVAVASRIEVLHTETSGEIEFALILTGGRRYVAVASDHTDRRWEKTDVGMSKQLVRRVMSREVWRYEEVAPHWDELLMRSYSFENGERTAYQSGGTAAILPAQEILDCVIRHCRLPLEEAVVFSGTLPVIGGRLRYGARFAVEMTDPVRRCSLNAEYDVMVDDWYRD